MKKLINALSKEKTQKVIFTAIILLVFGVFFVSLLTSGKEPIEEPIDPGNQTELPNETPIVQEEEIKIPCTKTYEVVRKFYSLDNEPVDQELAVIQFGSKYFISKGISIAMEDNSAFDVVSCLSGVVLEVTDSPIYGKTVILEHDDKVQTEYVSLSDVIVSVGDRVSQGDKLGTSGVNEYDVAALNHIHFKVSKNDIYCNPLAVIGKTTNEIE